MAGFTPAAIATMAKKVSGGYLIGGQKTWCSYAHRASRILLVARTSREDRPHNGLTIFEIPSDADGVATQRISTLGGREVNDVYFTDCLVPEENIVGDIAVDSRRSCVSLALARDLRVVAQSARMQLSFNKIGLIPDAGLTCPLPRITGPTNSRCPTKRIPGRLRTARSVVLLHNE
jgi:hypothetical protein